MADKLDPPLAHIDDIVDVIEAEEEKARLKVADLEDKLEKARIEHGRHFAAVGSWRAVRDLVALKLQIESPEASCTEPTDPF